MLKVVLTLVCLLALVHSQRRASGYDLSTGGFFKEYLKEGKVTLQSWHGRFLCAEPSGRVVADRIKAAGWERFEPIFTGYGDGGRNIVPGHEYIVFKTHHDTYLSAMENGWVMTSIKVSKCEKFQYYFTGAGEDGWGLTAGNDYIVLKSCHGKYLTAETTGTVLNDRDKVGPWEKFS
jgi:hypothetical protein